MLPRSSSARGDGCSSSQPVAGIPLSLPMAGLGERLSRLRTFQRPVEITLGCGGGQGERTAPHQNGSESFVGLRQHSVVSPEARTQGPLAALAAAARTIYSKTKQHKKKKNTLTSEKRLKAGEEMLGNFIRLKKTQSNHSGR